MRIIACPTSALADEFVNIRVQGLSSDECYTFFLSIVDEKNTLFKSFAHYKADNEGSIDLRRDAALPDSSYKGTFGAGLFATLKPIKQHERLVRRNVELPHQFVLSVWRYRPDLSEGVLQVLTTVAIAECDDARKESQFSHPFLSELVGTTGLLGLQRIDKHLMEEGVQRVVIKEGAIRGTLFIPQGPGPFPAIVDMFGAAGGLVEYRASLLASRGILTLALAYFRYDDLPRSLDRFELEYFIEAAEWLYRHPKANTLSGGIGILGASKGGELAVAAACHTERITALCTVNGNIASIGTKTTHQKSGAVYLPIPLNPQKIIVYDDGTVNIRNATAVPCPTKFLKLYSKYLKSEFVCTGRKLINSDMTNNKLVIDSKATESVDHEIDKSFIDVQKSMYPLEQISAPWCLFIAGEDDQNWSSPIYALEAERRMKGASRNVTAILYPKAGHYIDPPCAPFEEASYHRLAQAVVVWGGDPYYHQLAQVDCWNQIISFFNRALTTSKSKL